MGILDIGFAVGAIVIAALAGGLLYALYPNSFGGHTTASDSNSAASSAYGGSVEVASSAAK